MRDEVRAALREDDGLRLGAEQIARRLHCSASTLRRRLKTEQTSFTRERRAARAEAALEILKSGYPVEQAARRVGLSPDHMRHVLVEAYGFSPSRVKQMVAIALRLRDEPESRAQLEQARRDDELLGKLIGDLGATHPLYPWAKELIVLGYHPERESASYQEELKEKERQAYIRRRQRLDAAVVSGMAVEDLEELDVKGLLMEKEYRQGQMHWRANQRRRNRVAGGASR